MAVKAGTFTPGSTGSYSNVSFGFTPTMIHFIVKKKAGTDTVHHTSDGGTDGTNSWSKSTFADVVSGTTSLQNFESITDVIAVYERVSGTITKVFSATFTSFNANGFTLNVSGAQTGNYQVGYFAWG